LSPKKLVRDMAGIALSQYLSRFVQMFRGIIAARMLGPATYGSWNALLLLLDYGILTQLGLQQGLDQEVPASLARGDATATQRLKRGGVAGMMVLWCVFAAAMLAYVLYKPRRWVEGWGIAGVVLMVVAVLLQQLIFYHGTLLRSHGRIGAVSVSLSVQAIVGGLSGLVLLYPLGAWGLLVGWLVGQVVALVYIRIQGAAIAPLSLRPNEGTRQLLKRGFPIFLFLAATTLLKSIDRIMILKYLSVEALGYYSVGLMGVSMLLYLPESIAYVLYPRLIARFTETSDTERTARDMMRSLAVVAWLMPLVIGVAVFWVRELIVLFLPQYQSGVRAVSILLFGTLGLALSSIPSFYIMAIRRQVRLVPLALLAVVADVTLVLLFLNAGAKLEGVALAVSLVYWLYGLGLLAYASMFAVPTTRTRLDFVLRSALPSLLTVVLCVSLFTWVRPLMSPETHGWQSSALLSLLFLALYALMARRLKPSTGIVAMLRESNWPLARMLGGVWARD
jgi:O-antigen/teichoic acid export membrane protein